MKNKKSWYVKIWAEEKYIDLWSFEHFIGGGLLSCSAKFFNLSLPSAFIIALILMIVWEIYENVAKIYEKLWNKIFDIIVGVIGFFLMYFYSRNNGNFYEIISIVVLILFIVLLGWGYWAYRKRKN